MDTVFLMNVLLKIRLKSISFITNNHTPIFVSGYQLRTAEIVFSQIRTGQIAIFLSLIPAIACIYARGEEYRQERLLTAQKKEHCRAILSSRHYFHHLNSSFNIPNMNSSYHRWLRKVWRRSCPSSLKPHFCKSFAEAILGCQTRATTF